MILSDARDSYECDRDALMAYPDATGKVRPGRPLLHPPRSSRHDGPLHAGARLAAGADAIATMTRPGCPRARRPIHF
jgi:hypothetical protein